MRHCSIFMIIGLFSLVCGCQDSPEEYSLALTERVHNTAIPPYVYRLRHFRRQHPDSSFRALDRLIRQSAARHPPDSLSLLDIEGQAGQVYARIYGSDVTVAGSRFRIGLIEARPDSSQTPPFAGAHYLFLHESGNDSLGLDPSLPNVGRLQTRTFFEVDRQRYLLTYADVAARRLSFRPVARDAAMRPVASLFTRLPRIPVSDAQGQSRFLDPPAPGRRQLILLWSLGPDKGATIRRLRDAQDTLRQWDITLINLLDEPGRVARFLQEQCIDFPNFYANERTCSVLLCHSLLPFAILTDEQGRIESFFLRPEQLGLS